MKRETPLLDGIRLLKEQHRKIHGVRAECMLLSPELLDEMTAELVKTAGGIWKHSWESDEALYERMREQLRTNQVYFMGVQLRFEV